MASTQFLILAIVAILLPSVALATDYIVGDDSGWTINFDYRGWAKDKMFMVGDKLVFKYNATNHNVIKVGGPAFTNCTALPSNEVLDSGNDVITLAAPGKKWYICGKPNHCAKFGQKLVINVMSMNGVPEPAPIPHTDAAEFGAVASVLQVVVAVIVAVAMIAVY